MERNYAQHRIAVLLLSVCCLAASAQISKNCDFSNLQYQYNDTTVNNLTYRVYFADGLTLSDSPGAPALPCKIYSFSVPYNATNIAIQLNHNFAQYSQLQNCTIMPAMYPKAMCDTTPEQILPDSVIYSANAYYPNNLAEITSEGYYMGENHIINVAVYPMQYNPATGMLKRYQNISFTITYNAGIDSLSNVMVSENITMRQRAWNEVKKLVDNPSQVESFAPSDGDIHVIQSHYIPDSLLIEQNDSVAFAWSDLYLGDAEYLIVTTHELAPSFRRLAALKRQKGYSVGIKCIEDIIQDWNVRNGDRLKKGDGTYSYINDSAGRLRQFLRYSYSINNTSFVLFGGRNVPFRYGCLSDTITKPQTIMDNNTPTDMYYTDLNSNWNIDGDSYYGEPDELDYGRVMDAFPELFVGRLVADSINQIENYTNKLLRYELNPGKGDGGYLKRVLITDGMVKGFKGVTPFLSNAYSTLYNDVTLIPISSNPTGAGIINNISENKYGIVNIFGHGCPNNIIVNQGTSSLVWNFDYRKRYQHDMGLDMLDNKYFPFVIYSESCTNMPYDIYEIYSHNWVFNKLNLGQSFTLGKDYGGVAYLGNTRYGTAKFDSYGPWYQTKIESFFIECLENGYSKVGVAEAISKQKYCISSTDRLYMPAFPHNLMGEPEFDIWTDEPTNYTGINISRNDNSITVSGISADSTIVAICDNNGNSIRKYSVNGSATFTGVSPNSTIMLYKHNYLPYIAPMYIQNAMIDNSQYVIAKDVYIGRDVDTNRTLGGVTISSGVDYEMEFTGSVNITGGFEVEKGAEFTVALSDY